MTTTGKQIEARREYDTIAVDYDKSYLSHPSGKLEQQLISDALGDLTGLTVLDLAGGGGIHARTAIAQGAVAVDLVDISPGMIKVAQDIEASLGRNVMRFFEGDASKPLSHLPLREDGYDVVMANWLLNFAETTEVLDAMLANAAGYLKKGGLFVGIRTANVRSAVLRSGCYGVKLREMRPFKGGVRYTVSVLTDPPVDLEGVTLDVLDSGSAEVYERNGLTEVETIPCEAARVVQEDPEYWEGFKKDPYYAVVKAVRK